MLQTSSTSIPLKNTHCRVPSTRQMPFSNVMIDQSKSVTVVLHLFTAVPFHRKALRGVTHTLQAARRKEKKKKVFLVAGRTHFDPKSFLVVLSQNWTRHHRLRVWFEQT